MKEQNGQTSCPNCGSSNTYVFTEYTKPKLGGGARFLLAIIGLVGSFIAIANTLDSGHVADKPELVGATFIGILGLYIFFLVYLRRMGKKQEINTVRCNWCGSLTRQDISTKSRKAKRKSNKEDLQPQQVPVQPMNTYGQWQQPYYPQQNYQQQYYEQYGHPTTSNPNPWNQVPNNGYPPFHDSQQR